MVKKQLIMEKAIELFAKQGFEATSVQQITELCGISKGAFYLSFKSKDELILALIDQFMMSMTSDVDHLVRNTPIDKLLYEFYYAIFESFNKHSDFAKIFLKEQTQTFNEDFIKKMQYYDRLFTNIILTMVETLYGEEVERTKYDLVYCIKGFMKTYSELFIFYSVPLDLNLLVQSLVEKTNILSKQMTIPFVSNELLKMFNEPFEDEVSKDHLLEMIEQRIGEMGESVEKESLVLLKQQLQEPTLSAVLVKGLIENIRNHPQCKMIAFALRNYRW